MLYPRSTVLAVVEIAPKIFLLAINGEVNLSIYDLHKYTSMQLYNPTNSKIFMGMQKCPGYHYEHRPYVFLKDKFYISLINVRTGKILPILKSNFEADNIRAFNFHVVANTQESASLVDIYT